MGAREDGEAVGLEVDDAAARGVDPEGEGPTDDGESRGTVLLAGLANLGIAVAKLIGGLLSGSAAMLAEAAHSVADTLNELFLLAALERSHKPPDARHPFGYGMERYFWALLAAVGIFVLGAGYSIFAGVRAILAPEELGSVVVSYVVLALAFVLEGTSWSKAVRQLYREAEQQRRGFFHHLRITPDPTAKTVAFEDTAALAGILVAAGGITLHLVTGQAWWDGAASVAIGVLLVLVAFSLGQQNKRGLVGEAVPGETLDEIRSTIASSPGIDVVVEVLTMRLSPEQVMVAARVDLDDRMAAAELEEAADEVDRRVREMLPEVRHVFLDPTDAPGTGGHGGAPRA